MSKFAANTTVPVAKSKAEIENTLERYGAGQFLSGWSENQAVIGFTMHGRQIRFTVHLPDREDREFTHHSRGLRAEDAAHNAWEKACRQRWRALNLVIKAKLEAIESGISEFEDEFMANIVMPGGQTISQLARPKIADAYEGRGVGNLLPDYSK